MGKKRKQSSKSGAQDALPSHKRAKTAATAETVNFDGDLDGPTTATNNIAALDKSAFTDQPAGEERKREATIYELLGSVDISERIAAADALITGLLSGQGSPESVLKRHLEKRLFRGLASSRNASRVGFSLVLTEILGQLFGPKDLAKTKFPGLTFDNVLELLLETTQAGGNLPGQEERDFYFGQLFGLQCFVEAKILFINDNDSQRWHKILDLLLKAADKKVWLRSHCGWVIVEALPHMGQARAEDLLKKLAELGWAKTAEGVGIWLRARTIYSGIKTPAKPWRDPLAPGSIPELARVLKESVKSDTGEDKNGPKVKQGNASAQINFVWDLILSSFSTRDGTPRTHDKDLFKQFWSTVVDDGLFSKNATDGQKYRGFMIFQKFITGFGPDDTSLVLDLFTKNLMRCLVNQAAAEDRYLHRAALRCLDVIDHAVKASPELLVPVLKQLLGKWGAYDFDQKTNTKTIEKLMQWATEESADEVLKLLKEPVAVMKGDEKDVENLRQVYAQYILRLATQAKLDSEPSTTTTTTKKNDTPHVLELAISELASGAYAVSDDFNPQISDKTREVFRSRLSSAFARLTKRKEDFKHLCNAVASVKPTAVAMSEDLESERAAALKAMKKQLKASKKESASNGSSSTSLGLALLYAVAVLQLYNGAPDAIDLLQDLKRCSEKNSKDDGDEQTGTSELLVEILLSLVSQQSALMRQISQQVFEAFTSQISAEALELLTEPLVAEENQRGYQALFENLDDEEMVDADDAADSDAEDDEEDDDDDENVEDVEEDDISEIGSDVEFTTLNGDDADDSDDEEEQESGDEDNEDESAEAKELASFDDALAKLLKSRRLNPADAAEGAPDADSDDSDESDMTDSEMIALDSKLVEVFKQRAATSKTSKTKEKRDAKETVLNFKRRILELLDIYVKQEGGAGSGSGGGVAFNVLIPLLTLVRTTGDKGLTDRGIKTIENFGAALKKKQQQSQSQPSQANTDSDEAAATAIQLALLKQIHHEATQAQTHAFAKAASRASLVVASSILATTTTTTTTTTTSSTRKDKIQLVARAYADTQAAWAAGHIKMQPLFFSDWLNWCQGQASNASSSSS